MFAEYDAANPLLRQAVREVLERQLEAPRIDAALARLRSSRLLLTSPARPTPFAFPLLVEMFREELSTEALEARVARMVEALEAAAAERRRRPGALSFAGIDCAGTPMPAHPFDLTDKVALVTGAWRGLGLAIAKGLAQAGATVVLNGRRPAELAAAAKGLTEAGLHAATAVFDVTDAAAIKRGVDGIVESYGHLDIVVNNAGIQRRKPIVEFPKQDWDDVIATNLTAPFLVSQAALPGMIARRSGKIIHIASLMSDLARPTVVPYTAAKGGVRQLTRGMAVELAPHNIQVNAIAPGYFATEMNRALLDNAEFDAWVKKRTPAGRWGQPDEIAGLAVFLASAAADYVTGQMITIDGGMSVAL